MRSRIGNAVSRPVEPGACRELKHPLQRLAGQVLHGHENRLRASQITSMTRIRCLVL